MLVNSVSIWKNTDSSQALCFDYGLTPQYKTSKGPKPSLLPVTSLFMQFS